MLVPETLAVVIDVAAEIVLTRPAVVGVIVPDLAVAETREVITKVRTDTGTADGAFIEMEAAAQTFAPVVLYVVST